MSRWSAISTGRNAICCPTPAPVIVAACDVVRPPYPMVEGRHRQSLPRIPGRKRGELVLGHRGGTPEGYDEELEAWLVPWRIGTDRNLVITLLPDTVLILDVSRWPQPQDGRAQSTSHRPRDRILRRAARILDLAPGVFATAPSVASAYRELERVWNDVTQETTDPLGDLLVRQAKRLRSVMDDLLVRPRAVLRTEHRMLKLQDVRRIDAKVLRWMSTQPGRNTAERAGARQRVMAPKRYEVIATLENRVLRAFASLTVREAKGWLGKQTTQEGEENKKIVQAHLLRAGRIATSLRDRKVPEAIPPVEPNFPLRFDPRYREIRRAWDELRAMNRATELEWMWQNRTFMELLAVRAAMKLYEAASKKRRAGTLAHGAVLRAAGAPSKGRYLDGGGIRSTIGLRLADSIRPIEYRSGENHGSGENDSALGAVASAGPDTEIWWDAADASAESGAVGELPWTPGHAWDTRLEKWADQIIS